MEKLFLKTENENIEIEQGQIEKYNLEAGAKSPYNRYNIVNEKGEGEIESPKKRRLTDDQLDEAMSDGVIFTQSETIDISRGADSYI